MIEFFFNGTIRPRFKWAVDGWLASYGQMPSMKAVNQFLHFHRSYGCALIFKIALKKAICDMF
ncbi:hypothetical protein SAMN04488012_103128 [Palleronia salina]|uniref:Uncharacterized protein n=1 Tax=Palleronia salina TaxID=313368 RepID=A0A1M6EL07_9RHOB|nr:hypothetical protein SAMN04488012_103128 [Palleronia salina]